MLKPFIILYFSLLYFTSYAQIWEVSEIGQLPEPVSNNAVCEGFVGTTPYLYSFGGIDTSKIYSGIHLHSYRVNTLTGTSESLPDLPDTLGKIAAGASRIQDTIYIIGGYHVFSNGHEVSSNKVHRFNIATNSYLTDASNIPTAIDDHVQAIWRDSLIYIITGWSNTTNVPHVQIYNPSLNTWTSGTATPNNNHYKSFGASGTIIGDTIYYFGGASSGWNFPAQNQLRKGVINPNDPTDITWNYEVLSSQIKGYRMACTNVGNQIHWLGGSNVTYNYNGVAYNGSGGVSPNNRDLYLDTDRHLAWVTNFTQNYPMDLRGIANISTTEKYIAGGMLDNQTVTDKVYRLSWEYTLTNIGYKKENSPYKVFPNPIQSGARITIETTELVFSSIELYDIGGKLLLRKPLNSYSMSFMLPALNSGIYYLHINSEKGKSVQKISVR
ncbi:MAG: T9SS type A sorting domain-containing protein [Flavobacteriales bacterium]|jgi:hypothetical protein|nr:T9SS type A sorting domain-containing protein [Flavobacteriales bacterium]